ncbi:MAG: endonuclease/exonuclease/phosphatase family protein [Sulfitobacter sp.]|nr:endonuclease/exonuclease/phosphatase family protein [Sulfitobacter sp.]
MVQPLGAEVLRIASFNTELSRQGPGLLYRDLLRGEAADIRAVVGAIAAARPDVIALQGIDYDLEGRALSALQSLLNEAGHALPHALSLPPNAGRMTDLDLDGDGRKGGPRDAQGYGRFFGEGAMAILSRIPIARDRVTDRSDFLWQDLPGAIQPQADDAPFPSIRAQHYRRLHSHGAWIVPLDHPGGLQLLTWHASPPVFDGPEDLNGRRNHDETRFWQLLMEGDLGPVPSAPFVLLGDANLDPTRGEGLHAAITALLSNPRLQDPQEGVDTVVWEQTGPMRVDYILPSADLLVQGAGAAPFDPAGSRHRLIWVDLDLPD